MAFFLFVFLIVRCRLWSGSVFSDFRMSDIATTGTCHLPGDNPGQTQNQYTIGGSRCHAVLLVVEPESRQRSCAGDQTCDQKEFAFVFVVFDQVVRNAGQVFDRFFCAFTAKKRWQSSKGSNCVQPHRSKLYGTVLQEKASEQNEQGKHHTHDGQVVEDQMEVGRIHATK